MKLSSQLYGRIEKYLLHAYMIEGEDIFKNEENKYFNIVREDI